MDPCMTSDSPYGQVLRLPRRPVRAAPAAPAAAPRPALTDLHPARPADPAATGFALARLADRAGPVLWVQDHASRRENGRLYTPGLRAMGIDQPILHVAVNHPRDALWAMEEGAACAGLAAVVGEIHGAPAVLSFTATKRLVLRAEASGVPVYLIRGGDPGTLSAARERWRLSALPSAPHPDHGQFPGAARWEAELFRARGRAPGRWVAQHDPRAQRPADRLRLVSRPDDGAVDAGDQPLSDRSGG
ncbi:hypothetical protein DXV76_13125 [Rhodobacteraceae bacterium CCMM004]|nr:hypothetical protein DXV76_13125 [Rhodobacteraceae bacterium CCMM004]